MQDVSGELATAVAEFGDTGLRPLGREMLHEQIYAMLRDELMMGRFAPGQKLPLRSLAKLLGTSLMPVRDALQRLESQGCIVSTSQRTMMIPELSMQQQSEICHLRVLLECEAARLAATNRSEKQLHEIAHYCDQIQDAGETADIDLFLTSNYKFHIMIAEASGLVMLPSLLEPLWMRLGPSVRASKPDQDHLLRAVGFHRDILRALENRDPVAAEAGVRRDIEECKIEFPA